ncbi:MAG TPA: 6-pyruvoyl-tetrahydropterin synthase-related protein [Candidatus Acidoferrales bacterium]|nr:6-pyruvoyl-tetrahydropterin synthase-related protein [Candidatus Acidoferrales bacterium]
MSLVKKYLDILIIIALTIFTLLPLFHPGFFPMHDDEQIGRLYDLHKDVIAGQIPPRLAQDLGFGFDYPLFNFYPPFVYYIGEVFHLFGFSLIVSTKLMIALGFLLAGIFMYLFVKEYAGRIGGIVGAIAYTYTPYHSVDVYVRGAMPEFWSFVFVPAIFWSINKLAKTDKNVFIFLSTIFVAGLILTHDLIALMSSFFLGAFFVYLVTVAKKKRVLFFKICISVALGLAFTSYFWLPAYFEKQYTMVNLLTDQLADYHLHFVCIKQFVTSPWGYGGSLLGCEDGLSFQVGQAQLIAVAISLFVSAFFLFKKRKHYGIVFLFLFLFLFSLFIQTNRSVFIWDKIPQFAYIQFPWRFLLFSDFTAAFLIAYMFTFIKKRKVKMICAGIIVLLLIFLNKDYFRPDRYLPTATDTSYTASSVINWRTSIMSFEYTPRGIATKQSSIGNTVINITQNEIPKKSFTVISGKMSVTQLQDIPQQKEYHVSVMRPGLLQLNTFTFPGWQTYIDDRNVAYTDNNKFKLITVRVPKGEHTVRAVFTDTRLRTVANGLSVTSIIGVIVYGLVKKKRYGKT